MPGPNAALTIPKVKPDRGRSPSGGGHNGTGKKSSGKKKNGVPVMSKAAKAKVMRRFKRKLAGVFGAVFFLAFVVGSAMWWHWINHPNGGHHKTRHRYKRQRTNMPSWLQFPSTLKLSGAGAGRKKPKNLWDWAVELGKHIGGDPPDPRTRQEQQQHHFHLLHLEDDDGMGDLPHPHPHDASDHGHAEHEHHEHHHHHHHEHSATDDLVEHPRLFVGEVIAVIMLSTIFETWEHTIRHRLQHQGRVSELKILDCLFKEVTCLGFIGLVMYLVHRFSIVDALATKLFSPEELVDPHENPLFETFELVHMMIFLLLIVLLFQAATLLPMSHNSVEKWRRFERTTTWGQKQGTLETMFVEAGYLERKSCPSSNRGVTLESLKPFTYGGSFLQRALLRRHKLVRVILWRAVRHEFLFPDAMAETLDPNTPRTLRGTRLRKAKVNPSFFSFEGYLRGTLSNTVVALVEVDMITWGLTLLFLVPLMYSCIVLHVSIEFLQFIIAWVLLFFAVLLVICLEEDLYALTPTLPEDARRILRIFSGTSMQDFQRTITPRGEDPCHLERVGAPGLGGLEVHAHDSDIAKDDDLPDEVFFSCETYRRFLRLLAFWQALCVTSLVVSFLSHPFARTSSVFLHCSAWVEWPLMLFGIWPMLVRKLTMRYSLDEDKDWGLIRATSLHSKENLLRHHVRLMQVFGYFCRAAEAHEPWADLPNSQVNATKAKDEKLNDKRRGGLKRQTSWRSVTYQKGDADRNLHHGQHIFQSLGDDDQEELWELFELLDTDGDETVDVDEIVSKFKAMGLKENVDVAAKAVLRLVDYFSIQSYIKVEHGHSPSFSWEKFRAMVALTTFHRPKEELLMDLNQIFNLIEKNSYDMVTVFEITEWMRGIKRSTHEADVASVLHKHFCEAKPLLTREEFVEWMKAILGHEDDEDHGGGHHH